MTDKKTEALKLALEVLEYIHEGANNQGPHTGISWRCVSNKAEPAITAIREALAEQPAQQQCMEHGECFGGECIYAAQQPAQQQEPVAYGATHRQSITGALYKKIDSIWYVWCRLEDEPRRWMKSLGTSESCLEPITSPQPADEPVCPICKGTGEMDSGGTHPWGWPINIACECTRSQPAAWVGLTDEDKKEVVTSAENALWADVDLKWRDALMEFTEAKLKEKNA